MGILNSAASPQKAYALAMSGGLNGIKGFVGLGQSNWAPPTGDPAIGVPMPPAIWSVNRISDVSISLYKNAVQQGATNTLLMAPPSDTAFDYLVGAVNANGSPLLGLNVGQRVAGYMLMDALTVPQMNSLQTAWAAFNTALGR